MNNRKSPVPEGHATIAQRFNVGLISGERSSPQGMAETARAPSAVPSGRTTGYLSLPNVETLGYCRASLRDEEQILLALSSSSAPPCRIRAERELCAPPFTKLSAFWRLGHDGIRLAGRVNSDCFLFYEKVIE